ncbi:7-ethoxycoumarin O-deethylase-like [Rutidosis leptorrhynchoides]|uniref:7-ethoxycoumarin O-deethylase-like n=1 Tax=Rutidosis leptorrhynchoides TaxID=125765 RepID=UPI003A9A2FBB
MEFLVIIGLLIICYAFIRSTFSLFVIGNPKNQLPGPNRLPIIGNLHLLGDQPHQSLAKLAKIHGPIMSLKLGQINTLVISSAEAAKEVLKNKDLAFSTRNIPDSLHAHNHYKYSVAFLPVGATWRALRKILNSNMFSGKCLDDNQHLRSQKVRELIAYCQKASASNNSVNIGRAAFRTSLNLLSNTIFSKDLTDPYDEDSGKEFKEVVSNIMVEVGKPNLVDYFPILKKLDPQMIKMRLTSHFGTILDMFEELIKERSMTQDEKKNDVLDVCLNIIQNNQDDMTRSQVKSLFLDLFAAGTDTTSNTLEWAMTEVLLNPHIMSKAKEELEKVIGKGNIVTEDDVLRLPYLSCIVKETLRLHPSIPFLLPRKLVNQVNLNEYVIPKGTLVLVNAYAIGRDPSIWEDSLKFTPERFLKSQIDVRGLDFELIPFGGGRRICPGMPLAMRMIPVMLGSLLNNFDWNVDLKIEPKSFDMTEKFGITIEKASPLCAIPIPLN